jgi:hypothetical protein
MPIGVPAADAKFGFSCDDFPRSSRRDFVWQSLAQRGTIERSRREDVAVPAESRSL